MPRALAHPRLLGKLGNYFSETIKVETPTVEPDPVSFEPITVWAVVAGLSDVPAQVAPASYNLQYLSDYSKEHVSMTIVLGRYAPEIRAGMRVTIRQTGEVYIINSAKSDSQNLATSLVVEDYSQ